MSLDEIVNCGIRTTTIEEEVMCLLFIVAYELQINIVWTLACDARAAEHVP